MTSLNNIAIRIIKEQELIIGPLAWNEAEKVNGLKVTITHDRVEFNNGDERIVVDQLVARYERLFGRASREVCRHAAASLIAELPADQVPASLK